MPVITVVCTAALMLWRRSWTPLLLVALAAAGSVTMSLAGKAVIGRVRPPHGSAVPPYEASPAFPSGHTLAATVIVGMLAYLTVSAIRSPGVRVAVVAAAGCWIVAMGLSRVYLGHHWFTDVAVGWTLGCAWLAFLITIHRLRAGWPWPRPAATARARSG